MLAVLSLVSTAACTHFDQSEAYWHYTLSGTAYCTENVSKENFGCRRCRRSTSTVRELFVLTNASTDVRAFLGVFRRKGASDDRIVLSVRGTESLENWIENLKLYRTDRAMSCSGCRVHSGFYDVWASLQPSLMQQLDAVRQRYPNAPLTLTGHSLGAAVAILGGYILERDLSIPVQAVYTFGSPRVGNAAFASTHPVGGGRQWRITHHRDVVPHLPEKLLGFRHTATEVFYANATQRGVICDGSGEDDTNGADQYSFAFSVYDHLHYYGQTIGENGC